MDTDTGFDGDYPPIHIAAQRGTQDCIEILVADNIDAEVKIRRLYTLLRIAVILDSTSLVERTLAYCRELCSHPDPTTTESYGWTIVHDAPYTGSIEVVQMLRVAGFDVKSRDIVFQLWMQLC